MDGLHCDCADSEHWFARLLRSNEFMRPLANGRRQMQRIHCGQPVLARQLLRLFSQFHAQWFFAPRGTEMGLVKLRLRRLFEERRFWQ